VTRTARIRLRYLFQMRTRLAPVSAELGAKARTDDNMSMFQAATGRHSGARGSIASTEPTKAGASVVTLHEGLPARARHRYRPAKPLRRPRSLITSTLDV
jgi:hypothetical protein